jgi:hypothetical protein
MQASQEINQGRATINIRRKLEGMSVDCEFRISVGSALSKGYFHGYDVQVLSIAR